MTDCSSLAVALALRCVRFSGIHPFIFARECGVFGFVGAQLE